MFLTRAAIRHPILAVLLALGVTLVAAVGLPRIDLRTDGLALIPPNTPVVAYDEDVRVRYGIESPLVLLVRSNDPSGIFNPRTLSLIRDLTEDVQLVAGIDSTRVLSLATERGFRVIPGTLRQRRFLDPLPATSHESETLRADLEKIRLYTGTLVSKDGTAAAIQVELPSDRERGEVLEEIAAIVAHRETEGDRVDFIGAPAAEALLGSQILDDLGVPRDWLEVPGDALAREDSSGIGGFFRRIGLVPAVIALMALVFAIAFRSPLGVALPLVEILSALAFTLGLMGWLGVPVYLTTTVLPVVLIPVAVMDEIHVFGGFAARRRKDPDATAREVVTRTMEDLWRPVLQTALTTAVGFLSFAFSPIAPVRAFGLFTGIGVLYCMLFSLAVVPAVLSTVQPRFAKRGNVMPYAGRALAAIAGTSFRRRGAVLLLAALIALGSFFGIRRLVVQDSWIGGFARGSEFRRATEAFHEGFLGSHLLYVEVETGKIDLRGETLARDLGHHTLTLPALGAAARDLAGCSIDLTRTRPDTTGFRARFPKSFATRIVRAQDRGDSITLSFPPEHGSARMYWEPKPDEPILYRIESRGLFQPETVERLGDFEEFLQGFESVGGVLGPSDYLATTNFLIGNQIEENRAVPDNPDRIRWLWSQLGRVRGEFRLREIVDPDFQRALVSVFLQEANFVATARLLEAARAYAREHLEPHGLRIDFAGDVAVSQTLIGAIVNTQVQSLALSLLGNLIVAAWLGRSLRWGFLWVIPSTLAVAVNFGVMGFLGIPLGVATSMFAGMTLGIGIDFAIHPIERYRRARAAGTGREPAIRDAMAIAGPPMIVSGLAVAIGMGMLLFSSVPANARLGLTAGVCVLACLFASIVLLPAIVSLGEKRGR